MNDFTVFYSWQSDLPATRSFIQKALSLAANALTAELSVSITIDQATRGLTGSPNIPLAIMKKIKEAGMVVSDVTPINAESLQKKTPNPNVLFELGFAVAALGWDRVALVFDEGIGKFPDDVPFDFDKHRGIPFTSDVKKLNALAGTLKNAIRATIEANPTRPTATLSPEQLKHERDVETLVEIFETIDIQAVDQHIADMPRCINAAALHVWESFSNVSSGSDVYLNDAKLFDLIQQFRGEFWKTLAHEGRYHEAPNGIQQIFTNHDTLASAGSQKAWDEIDRARKKMHELFQAILQRVRWQFLEVDLKATSRTARKDYLAYRRSLVG